MSSPSAAFDATDATTPLPSNAVNDSIPPSPEPAMNAHDNAIKLEQDEALETKSVVSSDDSTTNLDRKPMKNTSRERMKAETTFLRARVQELERELSQTLAKKALERCTTPSPVWRDLAKRHAVRREKAEQERDRLRARLLHQLQVAKSLETIFRNRAGAFIDDLCASASTSGHKTYPVDNLALLHDQFMDEIDHMYPLVDTIFAEHVASHDAMETPVRRSSVVCQQTSGEQQLFVELRNTVYVPFAFARVCDAIWRAVTTEYSRQQRVVEPYRCSDVEYSCTFVSPNDVFEGVTEIMSAIVMRKFTEANRMVLVWRSVDWDPTPSAQGGYGDDKGWITVSPMVDSVTGEPHPEGAIVCMCNRYVPIWEVQAKLIEDGALQHSRAVSASGDSNLHVGEFTNRILNGTEQDITAITESIENILLDESIGAVDDDVDLESMIEELEFDASCTKGLMLPN